MKWCCIIMGWVLAPLFLQAQDLHFSHFYQAPLQLNPALTGFFDGDLRIGGNYRNQWQSITEPYQTFSVWGDYNYQWQSKTQLSIGLVTLRDQAGDGNLTTNKGFLSGAIHHQFNENIGLGLGVGVGFIQKSLDFSQLIFDNQWTTTGFDLNRPTNELMGEQNLNYTDFQAGLLLEARPNRDLMWYAGAAVLHANQPRESFYDIENRVGLRPVAHVGALFRLNDTWHLEPAALYMRQKGAQEFMAGFNVGYTLPNPLEEETPTILFAGAWWRGTGNAIPTVGIEYKRIRGLLTYDFQVGQLQTASQGRGGMELSVVYIMQKEKRPGRIVIPCYRF